MIGAAGFGASPRSNESVSDLVLCGGCYKVKIPYWGKPYLREECLCEDCMKAISEMMENGEM